MAYCRSAGIKSLIGDFRDNRFNGTFETAAQIYHHLPDIIKAITMLEEQLAPKKPNLKVQSVAADLRDPCVVALVKGLATAYVHITSPFWDFVQSNLSYLNMYTVIQPLHTQLVAFTEDPSPLGSRLSTTLH